ncbi:MAG: hypothetical protein WCI72_01590 [archaeon]
MEKLERLARLIPYDDGGFKLLNGLYVSPRQVLHKGDPNTFVVQNPCLNISREINERAAKGWILIPDGANSYVVSDFNPDTQHVRHDESGKEKNYSVYAVQFYRYFG